MFWKRRGTDSVKLRKIIRELEDTQFEVSMLRAEVQSLRHAVTKKEVTHTKTIKVTIDKPMEWDGWLP